jgi:1-acyl-sn-glycerol-3-phosphate acyltransferase
VSHEISVRPTQPTYEDLDYDSLLADGRELFPGARIGRPGRSRGYWAMIAAMRLLRVRFDIEVRGAERIADGPAIVVGNHVSWVDPVAAVMSNWWRVTAFTKAEAFHGRGAIFFRIMGQIPLRRGDEEATHWAMAMSRQVLADGSKIGIYPEGTRSPEPDKLYRLHKRVLVPLLQENPDIPVHALVTKYQHRPGHRTKVTIDISEPLATRPATMDAVELTEVVRAGLVATGGLGYVDTYARDAKRRAAEDAADTD